MCRLKSTSALMRVQTAKLSAQVVAKQIIARRKLNNILNSRSQAEGGRRAEQERQEQPFYSRRSADDHIPIFAGFPIFGGRFSCLCPDWVGLFRGWEQNGILTSSNSKPDRILSRECTWTSTTTTVCSLLLGWCSQRQS